MELVVKCTKCNIILPETDFIDDDNSNASVHCECSCQCEDWYCWPCAGYDGYEKVWMCGTCLDGECG